MAIFLDTRTSIFVESGWQLLNSISGTMPADACRGAPFILGVLINNTLPVAFMFFRSSCVLAVDDRRSYKGDHCVPEHYRAKRRLPKNGSGFDVWWVLCHAGNCSCRPDSGTARAAQAIAGIVRQHQADRGGSRAKNLGEPSARSGLQASLAGPSSGGLPLLTSDDDPLDCLDTQKGSSSTRRSPTGIPR